MDLLQIGIVGSSFVGKSTLIRSYLSPSDHQTKQVTYRKRHFAIRFLESDLESVHTTTLDAVMVVFDLTDEDTYADCLEFMRGCQKPAVLMGNKADLERNRRVETSQAVRRAAVEEYLYEECAALHGEQVDACLFLLLDLVIDSKPSHTCYRFWPPSERNRHRLQAISMVLSLATMFQGLGTCVYGAYFIVHMDADSTDWLGDLMLLSGVLTFIISFLGFYGSKSKGIKEYLKVVRGRQYGVLSVLEAASKLVVLLVFAASEGVGAHMYSSIDKAEGFREWMTFSLTLEVMASFVALLSMKSVSTSIERGSYFNFMSSTQP